MKTLSRLLIISLLFTFSFSAIVNTAEIIDQQEFTKAIGLYQKGQLDEALKMIEAMKASGKVSNPPHYLNYLAGLIQLSRSNFSEAEKELQYVLDNYSARLAARERGMIKSQLLSAQSGLAELKIQERDAAANLPRVKITTDKGEITCELFEDDAPNTVANFITLIESGFYNGTTFHRVIPNFMIQGGDPNSKDDDPTNDGLGGPDYYIDCEISEGYRRHFTGTLSMAHAGTNTGGSQFFITHSPQAHLDGKHTVFGRVLEGQSTVDAISGGDKIVKIEVLRKRDHEYKAITKAK